MTPVAIGRFQTEWLHSGHMHLIDTAFKENGNLNPEHFTNIINRAKVY